MNTSSTRERSREIRLGLVMYGGVSLAIYINGVAAEFFSAVRGRGVYKLIKALTDSDIVVDVVSGTSAGGINGVLLSYALCNEREFFDTAALWREAGDISNLLRDPREKVAVNSLLRGEDYFHSQILGAFQKMDPVRRAGEDVSLTQELDLFVTSTDVDGNVYTAFDDQGHAVDVKDHRAVFLLKHRAGRKGKEPFAPGGDRDAPTTHGALAKLCRMTSCFPVAFEPIVVAHRREQGPVDERLRYWGALPDKECAFLDGGVLDNKPFSYTAQAIYHRTANRRVDRKLFYVEPDPEVFARKEKASRPDVLRSALAALIEIPGYESIADDLKRISDRNSRIFMIQRIEDMLRGDNRDTDVDTSDRPDYELLRLIALTQRAVEGIIKHSGQNKTLDVAEKNAAKALFSIFHKPFRGTGDGTADGMRLARTRIEQFWRASDDELLTEFDVYFRMRRLFHAIYRFYDLTVGQPPRSAMMAESQRVERNGQARQVLAVLNWHLNVLEIIASAIETAVDDADLRWQQRIPVAIEAPPSAMDIAEQERGAAEVWKDVGLILRLLLTMGRMPGEMETLAETLAHTSPGTDLAVLHAALRSRTSRLCEPIDDSMREAATKALHSVLRETDRMETTFLEGLRGGADEAVEGLLRAYHGFKAFDRQIFPLQFAADLYERDQIDTIRISPRDAQEGLSRQAPDEKVSGDALHHFGGFFKRAWRSNDILWGRLDATCQLVQCFLTVDRMALPVDPEVAARVESGDLRPALMFPRAPRELLAEIEATLRAAMAGAAGKDEFKRLRAALIEAAQIEILHDDVPEVIKDDLYEQQQWNQFRTKDGKYETGKGHRTDLVSAAAAETAAQAFLDDIDAGQRTGQPRDITTFFKKHYRVGGETVTRSVPTLVLVELFARAMLVVRNALLTALGERGPEVRKHWLFKIGSGVLWFFYGITKYLRRSSCAGQVLAAVVAVLVVVAILLGLNALSDTVCGRETLEGWRKLLCTDEGGLRWASLAVYALLTILLFSGLAWVFRRAFTRSR